MSPSDVLEPILAPIRHDAEYPCIETPANFREMVIGFDKGQLEDVFGNIRTAGHAERVPVQGVAVPADPRRERLAITREDALDGRLVGLHLVDLRGGYRRLHGVSVMRSPRGG